MDTDLIRIIEQFDPGHFSARRTSLERLRLKVRELGFFPLPLTENDINCYWIRIEALEDNKTFSFQYDYLDDEIILDLLKKAAKYDEA